MTTTREPVPVDDSPLLDAVATGIYRIAVPTLQIAAIVLGAAMRALDRATDGLVCECGQPRRAHRYYRPGADSGAGDCERWIWAGWRHD